MTWHSHGKEINICSFFYVLVGRSVGRSFWMPTLFAFYVANGIILLGKRSIRVCTYYTYVHTVKVSFFVRIVSYIQFNDTVWLMLLQNSPIGWTLFCALIVPFRLFLMIVAKKDKYRIWLIVVHKTAVHRMSKEWRVH